MNAAQAAASAVFDELVRCGVRHVCLSPGSRSTPLAVAATGDDRLRTHVSIDERSSAFLAVGIARASGIPAVVLSTSGTAAANFLPAIAEASNGSVPLIAITADRPPELRGTGANQTIDQVKLYGDFVRWFCETGVPEDRPGAGAYWRSLACRAWAEATGSGRGPVHLNVCFREPLVALPGEDVAHDFSGRPGGAPWTATSRPAAPADPADVEWLASKAAVTERGVILAGAGEVDAAGVHALAAAAGWPVLAEPSSGLRHGPHAISAYEALLRSDWAAGHKPDFVLRIGKIGISRVVNAFFDHGVEQALVDPSGRWLDPERTAHRSVVADPATLCGAAAGTVRRRASSDWLDAWTGAERAARAAMDDVLDGLEEAAEPRIARDLAGLLPGGGTLAVAASMPVRDLDWFMAPRTGLRVLANRGANGIDGFVSTTLGIALASDGPVAALAGDLSMLHDQNGLLLAADGGVDATFVVLNNDGGGIFSFLPQAGAVPQFERTFATPHGVDFANVARAHSCGYRRLTRNDELAGALSEARDAGGVQLIEARTNRDANVLLHRELWAAAAEAVGG